MIHENCKKYQGTDTPHDRVQPWATKFENQPIKLNTLVK